MRFLMILGCITLVSGQTKNLADLATDLKLVKFLEAVNKIVTIKNSLTSGGPFTVFAGNDAAFAAISAENNKKLEDNTFLTQVLQYHMAVGQYLTGNFLNDQLLFTEYTGNKLRANICEKDKKLLVNGAQVVDANKTATKGVIHVIDKVLFPTAETAKDRVVADTTLSQLETAVTKAGLADTLNGPGPFTLFAPNNAAFAKIPSAELTELLGDVPRLTKTLKNHIVEQRVYIPCLYNNKNWTTLGGAKLVVGISGSSVKINGSTVLIPDYTVTNGVLHIIDTVLVVPKAVVPTTTTTTKPKESKAPGLNLWSMMVLTGLLATIAVI